MTMGTCRILILTQLTVLTVLPHVFGKVKYFGGSWNRPFRVFNLTVDQFIDDLSWRVGNSTAANGLNITLNPYSFKMNGTMLGLNLKGDVTFENGVVSKAGEIVPSVYAPYGNRTLDDSQGYINFTIRLTELDTLYNLRTELPDNDANGTVETTMTNIDFNFQIIHSFKTNENQVIVDNVTGLSFYSTSSWSIKPRYLQTYVIETLAKRDGNANTWYRRDVEAWQQGVLAPLIEEQSKGMEFPIIPY